MSEDIDFLYNKGLALFNLKTYQRHYDIFDKALAIDRNDVNTLDDKNLALHRIEGVSFN